MPVEAIKITDREQWLTLRKFDLTASVVSGAMGVSPYLSPLRLYLEKRGIEFPLKDSAPLRRGRRFEPAVAMAVEEERPGWKLEKCQHYYRDNSIGIGATPDYHIHGDARGTGCLQIKTVNSWVFEREWTVQSAPAWVIVQTRTESMLTDAAFGAIAVMVMIEPDYPTYIIEVAREHHEEEKIRQAVVDFWQTVEDGKQPDVNYSLDRALLAALTPKETIDKIIDLSADNEAMSGLLERAELIAKIKRDEERCSEIETMLMDKMGDAARAQVPGFSVSWKVQHRKGYIVQPSDPRVLLIRSKANGS